MHTDRQKSYQHEEIITIIRRMGKRVWIQRSEETPPDENDHDEPDSGKGAILS